MQYYLAVPTRWSTGSTICIKLSSSYMNYLKSMIGAYTSLIDTQTTHNLTQKDLYCVDNTLNAYSISSMCLPTASIFSGDGDSTYDLAGAHLRSVPGMFNIMPPVTVSALDGMSITCSRWEGNCVLYWCSLFNGTIFKSIHMYMGTLELIYSTICRFEEYGPTSQRTTETIQTPVLPNILLL